MKRFVFQPRLVLLLVLTSLVMGLTGCATDEPENSSVRPWNSPKGWETGGLPSSINEGH